MLNLARNAEDAARTLLREAGKHAVASAAKEALEGSSQQDGNSSRNYAETVDAFWRLRTREGIPAVRDVLYALRIDVSEL